MKIIADFVEVHLFREKGDTIEFLLLKRSGNEIYPGLWQMVTGKIEQGEKAYETALREIKEETGLDPVQLWVVPNVNSFYLPDNNSMNIVPVFAARLENNFSAVLCEEHCDWGWFSPKETKKLLAWEGQRRSVDVIHEYFTRERSFFNFVEFKIKD